MTYADPIPQLKRQLGSHLVALLDGWRAGDAAALSADDWRIADIRAGRATRR